MKILIANTQMAHVGGMETYLSAFVRAMRGRGHQIRVAAEYGIEVRNGESWCPMDIPARPIREVLTESPPSWKPDVVLCNPLSAPSLEEPLRALAPVVFFAHTFYGTCVSGTKMHALPSPRPCARVFGPACLALYYPKRCGGLSPSRAVSLFFLERRRGAFLRTVNHILVSSSYMKTELVANGINPGLITIVGLPAEGADVGLRKQYVPGRIIYVGRLTRVKGVDLLVKAVSTLPARLSTSVVVAGDGAERLRLFSLAERLRVGVEFRGWLTASETRDLISSAECLALPSVWPEPFGLVGLEAISSGVPVAAFDLGGVREWLVPGLNGEIAPARPPSVTGLAEALERVFALRSRWESAQEARVAQLEKFNARTHFDKVERVLRSCTT